MISKIKTLFWFLKRPKFYPFLVQLSKRRILNLDDSLNGDQTKLYCHKHQMDLEHLLIKLFGRNTLFISFEEKYVSDIKQATTRVDNLSFKMGGAGGLNLLYNVIKNYRPNSVIETGIAYGWSSLAILGAIAENELGRLISVDMPYPKMGNENFVGIAVPDRLRSNWTIIREPDRNGLKKALKMVNKTIDVCHYDSDKSYTGRKWAYPLLWSHLKYGGIFISDDIQDNSAFLEFSKEVDGKPLITFTGGKYVGVLRK